MLPHYLVKSMPSVIFSKKLFENVKMEECIICADEFKEGEDYVTPLACDARHLYHSDCIAKWVKQQNTCPMCKAQQTPNMM